MVRNQEAGLVANRERLETSNPEVPSLHLLDISSTSLTQTGRAIVIASNDISGLRSKAIVEIDTDARN